MVDEKYIKKILDNDFILSNIKIKGEISNFKNHSSGHLYFSLKDEGALIKCVMFRAEASQVKFKLEDGMKVIISGYVSAYERDGQYQLYCDSVLLDGVGDLYVAYEKLKEKLEKEGVVYRQADDVDRKIAYILMTADAEKVCEKELQAWTDKLQSIVDAFGEEKADEMLRMVEEFSATAKSMKKD